MLRSGAIERIAVLVGLSGLLWGCSQDNSPGRMPGNGVPSPGDGGGEDGNTGPGGDGGDGGNDGATGGDGGSGDGDDGDAGGTGDGGVKFDIGEPPDAPGGDPDGSDEGCEKIDFLFVVDNSGSMADEQQSLANSFPGFIASIQNTVMAQDYQIMVIDSDSGAQDTCAVLCTVFPDCNGIPCNMLPPPSGGCDETLGAGILSNPQGMDCGVVGGNRYMVDGQPNLSSTFSCAALVGTGGDGNERPMEAMAEAVTTLNGAGACNEAFVRDDAVLVVTFITDEEDAGKSMGNPASWKSALVGAKNGDEAALVVLGLVGDPDVPGTMCPLGEAEASPNLRTFADSFQFGSWGSICVADYAPFFDAAVSVIDIACDEFTPPG